MKIKNFKSYIPSVAAVLAGGFILANAFSPELKSTITDMGKKAMDFTGKICVDIADKYVDLSYKYINLFTKDDIKHNEKKEVIDTISLDDIPTSNNEIDQKTTEEPVSEESTEVVEEKPVEEPVEVIYDEYQDSYLLNQGYEFKDIDFDSYNEANSDVVGYIDIPKTEVSYKVFQRENDENNDYYLHKDENGNKSSEGSIYLDTRVDLSLGDDSSTIQSTSIPIFGHHMAAWRNEKMFRDVDAFKNQTYMDSHPYGVYYGEDGSVYALEVVAGYIKCGELDDHIMVYNLDDINTFNNYVDYINENALAKTNVSLEYGDKIVNLVTCSYDHKYKNDGIDHNSDKFVLVCKAVKQYTDENEVSENNSKTRKLK